VNCVSAAFCPFGTQWEELFHAHADFGLCPITLGKHHSMKTALIAFASAAALLASTMTESMAVSTPPSFTDWPMYLSDIGHSGYASGEDLISRSTASSLVTRFSLQTGAPVSAQPTVAAGLVFWGSWDGNEHATTIFGKPLWTTFVGKTTGGPGCDPSEVGVAGSPAYQRVKIGGQMRSVLFIAGGDHSLYALDAITGAVIWKTELGSSNADFLWDSRLYTTAASTWASHHSVTVLWFAGACSSSTLPAAPSSTLSTRLRRDVSATESGLRRP
jgi:PQQ enzyme repeat